MTAARSWPLPADADAACRLRQDLAAAGHAWAARAPAGAAVDALGGNSPFLADLARREPAILRTVLWRGPDPVVARLMARMRALPVRGERAPLMAAMRRARNRAALAIALADLGGWWTLDQVTGALSAVAETAIAAAVAHLLAAAHDAGTLRLPDPLDPATGSGLIVLGMGKLGGEELNYSSDVDLILLYDPSSGVYHGDDIGGALVRIGRALTIMLEQRTPEGFVARTDLRLRPDPASTPLVMSVPAAMAYYESLGETWERAAFIRARPVAGDRAAGQAVLRELRPFVWRRHLDFPAIADIHGMKRRIHAAKGGAEIAVRGHDVKLGRGGIREVEFCAQALQLIWGGREPGLRAPRTVPALRALARAGHLPGRAAAELSTAYAHLRSIEHRLQMVADRQTHRLPETEEGLASFATFMGSPSASAFATNLRRHLDRVASHYDRLFDAPLAAPSELSFTGPDPSPDTEAALRAMGFADPAHVAQRVRDWRQGRTRALRSPRARELFDRIVAPLLQALARQAQPDQAFARADAFVARLASGVQFFSMLAQNPGLMDRLATFLGAAPQVADYLSLNPAALEGLVGTEGPTGAPAMLLRRRLADATDLEAAIEAIRRAVHEERFRIGVATLDGVIGTDRAGRLRAALADAAVGALLPRVEQAFVAAYGQVRGAGMAVLALGKWGGRSMMAGSDLDLIMVTDADAAESEGARPLPAPVWFARLANRFVAALTAPGIEGPLFPVDLRLRPSGSKGPVAVGLDAFVRYHAEEAWTWEALALTRARVAAGPRALRARVARALRDALTRPRDPDRVRTDTVAMRARQARDLPPDGPWDVKHRAGGLTEVEFIAQALQLVHAPAVPEVLHQNTGDALAALARARLLPQDEAAALIAADRLWRAVQATLRLMVLHWREPALPMPVEAALLRAAAQAGTPAVDAADLNAQMARVADDVRRSFSRHLGDPASGAS